MKKVLALVLAAMMVMAMGVTAFADDYASDPLYIANSAGTTPVDSTLSAEPNASNSKAWLPLFTDAAVSVPAAEANVEGVKLTYKITEGSQYVSSVALAIEDDYNSANGEAYGILVKFKDYFDISKATVKLEVTVKSKRGSTLMEKTKVTIKLDNRTPVATIKGSDVTLGGISLTNTANYKFSNGGADFTIKNMAKFQADITTDESENTIAGVDFKADIEYIEINADLLSFAVKASEQGKLCLDFDQKAIKAIAREADPDAELTFFNFNAYPTFDFTGTVEIYLPDEDVEYYLYAVDEDGVLGNVRGAKLNEDGDAITFKTRTLGRYILSDMPLDIYEEEEVVVDVPVIEDEKVNPGTGA